MKEEKLKQSPTFRDLFTFLKNCPTLEYAPYDGYMRRAYPRWTLAIYDSREMVGMQLPTSTDDIPISVMRILRIGDMVAIENVREGICDIANRITIPIDSMIGGPNATNWWSNLDYGGAVRRLLITLLTSTKGKKIMEGTP